MGENYVLHNAGRDGAAVIMAMFPVLHKDEEFEQKFSEYYDQYAAGFPDVSAATNTMAILCDNVYRRVKDDTCEAHTKVTLDRSGNVMRVSQAQLDSGVFTPTDVIAGEFTIFAKTGQATVKRATVVVEHSDFVGKYELHTRALSPQEQALVPELLEWYIIPPEVVDVCKHAQATTEKSAPMRQARIEQGRNIPSAGRLHTLAQVLGFGQKKVIAALVYSGNLRTEQIYITAVCRSLWEYLSGPVFLRVWDGDVLSQNGIPGHIVHSVRVKTLSLVQGILVSGKNRIRELGQIGLSGLAVVLRGKLDRFKPFRYWSIYCHKPAPKFVRRFDINALRSVVNKKDIPVKAAAIFRKEVQCVE